MNQEQEFMMDKEVKKGLKEAMLSGPGPQTAKETVILMLKGASMGSADIIPGVSGGTMAFITGIYSSLVSAIAAVDGTFFKKLFSFRFIEAIEHLHTRFLIPLVTGILGAAIIMARPMHFLLNNYKTHTWAFFFGLILASIFIVGREIKTFKKMSTWIFLTVGILFAYFLVGAIPVTTPMYLWFIFLCGMIGAIAMILPGISGAFILLLLGKYEFLTSTLKNPFIENNAIYLTVFLSGMVTGLVIFSKLLKYLLSSHEQPTMIILTGFMIGAMRKLWPWKSVLSQKVIGTKVYVLEEMNRIPESFNASVMFCILLMVIGFLIVFSIDRVASKRKD